MKVLLIFPPQINQASPGPVESLLDGAGSFPPLGLLHLATAVKNKGRHEIKVIDSCLDNLKYDDIKRIVLSEKPEVVGITLNTENLTSGYLTVKAVKEANSSITVIAGGSHVFIYPLETISWKEIDYAVRGEADEVFPEMLDRLSENKSLEGIDGLIEKSKTYTELPRAVVDNMENVSIPDRTFTNYKGYSSIIAHSKPVTTIMSSRGCCFKCPFCPAGGTKIRDSSVEKVMEEIENCLSLGINDILFFDELFTFNKKRVMDICAEIKKRKLQFRWHIRARIQGMDKEMVSALSDSGCTLIQFGIESGTERIQKVLNKNLKLAQVEEVISLAKKAGILTYGNFMIGSPGETKEEIFKTYDFAKKLKLDYAIFAITKLLPGTGFYKDALSSGQVGEDFWLEYAKNPMYKIPNTYCTEEFSKDEIEKIASEVFKGFYFRFNYIVFNYIFRIFNFSMFKVHLAAALKIVLKRL